MTTALTPARRKALYVLGSSIGALAVAYGLVSAEKLALWLALIPAALNVLAYSRVDSIAAEETTGGTVAGPAAEADGIPEGADVEPLDRTDPSPPPPEVGGARAGKDTP